MLECPRCGRLTHFTRSTPHPRRAARLSSAPSQPGYDPETGRWTCQSCRLVCVLGLLAWPVKAGSHSVTRPRDQVPNERQLAQMRAETQGLWMAAKLARRRADDSNITAECSCREGTAYTTAGDPHCPIHGGEEGPVPEVED